MREFVELAFGRVGRTIAWRGQGLDEHGVDAETGDVLVRIDPRYVRPTEAELLHGDPSKAHRVLDWRHRTTFAELVREMVEADLEALAREPLRRERV